MSDDFDEHEPPDISGTLVRSFFAVTTGIVIATFGYFTLIAIAMLLFFPPERGEPSPEQPPTTKEQTAQVEKKDEEVARTKEHEKNEEARSIEIPPQIFVLCPFVQALMAFAGGYVAAKLAPSSPVGHGALVAGFVLLTTMQLLLNKEALMPTWVSGINAVAGPACVMWGASLFAKRSSTPEDGEP